MATGGELVSSAILGTMGGESAASMTWATYAAPA